MSAEGLPGRGDRRWERRRRRRRQLLVVLALAVLATLVVTLFFVLRDPATPAADAVHAGLVVVPTGGAAAHG